MAALDGAETRPLVMIVEPDPLVRELLEDGLEAEGFAWVSAPGDDEALRLLEALPCALHGLVVPLRAGRVTGWFLAQLALRSSPGAAVVYTADTGLEPPVLGRQPDAEILVKPFRPDQLVERLRRPVPSAAGAGETRA